MKTAKLQDSVLLALRLLLGALFIFAAYGKWIFLPSGATGLPAFMIGLMWFVSIAETLGAIAIIIGFLTRLAASGLGIIIIGSIFFLSLMFKWAFFTVAGAPGWDFNLLILVGLFVLISFGPGNWSIDVQRK